MVSNWWAFDTLISWRIVPNYETFLLWKCYTIKVKTLHRLLNTYFDDLFCNVNLRQFDSRFEDLNFEVMDDALKIVLYYFINRILNRRKDHCQINFPLVNEVNDIDHFWNCPWGHLSWEMIYESLDNVLNNKYEKFKKTRLEKPNHEIKKYNVYSFTSGFRCIDNFLWIN